MSDLNEIYTVDYLMKYDVVMTHAYNMLRRKQKGPELPPCMEIELHNKAKDYALALHRQSLKDRIPYMDIYYKRIIQGAI